MDNPGHLIAVDDGTNPSKSDRDPAHRIPPNDSFLCAYLSAWIAVKRKSALTVDEIEAQALREMMADCMG